MCWRAWQSTRVTAGEGRVCGVCCACSVLGCACSVLGCACSVLDCARSVLGRACSAVGCACSVLGCAFGYVCWEREGDVPLLIRVFT